MLSTLLNLSYQLWVATLIVTLLAGAVNLVEELLPIFHRSATYANNFMEALRVWLFRTAIIAAIASFGTVGLARLIGGGINAH